MQRAKYYTKNDDNSVNCLLCPIKCKIIENKTGFCSARTNKAGELYSLTYGRISGLAFDPIEKKPLYHFYPGKEILSIGSAGCNLKCVFCQNYDISQMRSDEYSQNLQAATSEQLLEFALNRKNNIGIAYTYNEPLINFEFILDTAQLFKKNNLKNVLVSNGYINEAPLNELLPFIDAANIDLKGIGESFYKDNCKAGSPADILRSIEILFKNNIIIEVTNLIVTGLNDEQSQIRRLVDSVHSLSPDIPLHFSRYYPRYKYAAEQTAVETLNFAFDYAKTKQKYVYIGNIHSNYASNTYCYNCGELLIKRLGYNTKSYLDAGRCQKCKTRIFGYF